MKLRARFNPFDGVWCTLSIGTERPPRGEPKAEPSGVDLGRNSELGRLDDAAVDDVKRRRVRVARLESFEI